MRQKIYQIKQSTQYGTKHLASGKVIKAFHMHVKIAHIPHTSVCNVKKVVKDDMSYRF